MHFLKLAGKDKCLFVHIMLKDILFFHCRNVKYNMSVCMCAYMYVCIYTAHSHMHIYLKAEYKDISKHLVWIQIFSSSFFFIPARAHVWNLFSFVCVYFFVILDTCVFHEEEWGLCRHHVWILCLHSPVFNLYPWVDPVPMRKCHFETFWNSVLLVLLLLLTGRH